MVHRTYVGLGAGEAAVRAFDALAPYVAEMIAMRTECLPGVDQVVMGVPLQAIRTTAYHFTRRPDFYHPLEEAGRSAPAGGNGRLRDRAEAVAAFQALAPYSAALQSLQLRCRPFGRDYLALDAAREGLETAAYHFTGEVAFYGARNDSAGPIRPQP